MAQVVIDGVFQKSEKALIHTGYVHSLPCMLLQYSVFGIAACIHDMRSCIAYRLNHICHSEQNEESPFFLARDSSVIKLPQNDILQVIFYPYLIAGLIVASPYVIYEFWRFLKPALYDKEKKHTSGAVFYMSMLFITGVLFGYYLIVPLSIHFLGSYSISAEVASQINMRSYISTVTSISLASGGIFELPVLVFFLSKVGLLTPEFLRKYRKHAYVALLLLSAIITPPDIFSQVMVCFPLVFLYEIGIVISKRVMKKAEEELEAM